MGDPRPREAAGMADAAAATAPDHDATSRVRRLRNPLLLAAIARYLVPIMAIPLAPVLLPDRVELLTLLRPGKEVLLAAGGFHRTTDGANPDMLVLFLAFLPLMVGGVWVFFWLGRAWQRELAAGDGPDWLDRLVPPDVFAQLQRLLTQRGPVLAFLGRVAALPPTIMGAAAGTSEVDARRYLVADFLGALVSFATTVGAGWLLGEAWERGGIWLTAAGIVVLLAIITWATSWLRREPEPAREPALDTDLEPEGA